MNLKVLELRVKVKENVCMLCVGEIHPFSFIFILKTVGMYFQSAINEPPLEENHRKKLNR